MTEPVFAVMGYLRSGTSMMMECLIAGGMDAAYDPDRLTPLGEPHYELPVRTQQLPYFPKGYEGRLIKMLADLPAAIRPFSPGIKAVWMHRPAQQVYESWIRAFGQCPFASPERLDQRRHRTLEAVRNRRDVELTELSYEDVLERPSLLRQLGSNWQIELDWNAAEKAVDRRRNHFPAYTGVAT